MDKNLIILVKKNMKKIRLNKNLKISDLANKINYSENYISKLENINSKNVPSIRILGKYADALNVDIKDFFEK